MTKPAPKRDRRFANIPPATTPTTGLGQSQVNFSAESRVANNPMYGDDKPSVPAESPKTGGRGQQTKGG